MESKYSQWAKTILEKADQKLKAVVIKNAEKIPYSSAEGRYDDMLQIGKCWWTNGFWPA